MEAQRAAEKEADVEQALENGSAAVGMVERLHMHVLAWKQLQSLVHIAIASGCVSAQVDIEERLTCKAQRRKAAVGRLLISHISTTCGPYCGGSSTGLVGRVQG